MSVVRVAVLALAAVLLGACRNTQGRDDWAHGVAHHALRAPVTNETFYFVLTDRFDNADPANDTGGLGDDPMVSGSDPTNVGFYHGGDLKGLTRRLGYIKGLGVTSIWLTPVFKNQPVLGAGRGAYGGYHGYWPTDFTRVDPHLGSDDDLRALIAAAHARGMKIYLDIIVNHTADVIGHGGPTSRPYIAKADAPYKDAAGRPFDDRDYAGTDTFPPLDPRVSFPYPPQVPPGMENARVPAWLNDLTLYHNRGNTTFAGEDANYGDFMNLDDVFTEHPRVVEGMIEIYQDWVANFGIDGFRIDTMKHVNDELWQQFGPRVLAFARAHGRPDFFMFGEVFDGSRPFTSKYTTKNKMQAVLDFPFQGAARDFASHSAATNKLRALFEADDWYTDGDSNVYQLPTFLGNHDMPRIGGFVIADNPDAPDAERLARCRLAHELMFFARGNPIVYYGDEQGFTGPRPRQSMFASRVAEFLGYDLLGTDATHAQEQFNASHPLYGAISNLAKLTRDHPALRNGAQQHRYASDAAGVYAFSRIDRDEQREYVVALNNSEQSQAAAIPTYVAGRAFERLYGDGPSTATSAADRTLTLGVGPLACVVYRSVEPIDRSPAAPPITLNPPAPAKGVSDRMRVSAAVDGASFYEITFQARVAGGAWTTIGTDDSAPYQVFHDVAAIPQGTTLHYRAAVLDNAGHVAGTAARDVERRDVPVVERTVTIRARVPDGVGTVYVAGNVPALGPWDPAKFAMEGTGRDRVAVFRVPDETLLEFKFTLGSWAREAVAPGGMIPANHSLLVDGDKEITIEVPAFKTP
jgi:alpha-amylase